MKEYDIKITETLERTVTVKAESVDDAKAQVEEERGKSMHVLDSEDFAGVEFTMQEERTLDLEKMDVLLIEPGQFPKRIQIGTELENLQKAVKGDIEVAYPFEEEVGVIVNEEHKINGMELNRAIFTDDGVISDIYAGPFLVVGLTEDDFGSLSSEQMEKYEKMFHSPQTFVRMGGSYMVLLVPDDMVKPKETTKGIDAKTKHLQELGEI